MAQFGRDDDEAVAGQADPLDRGTGTGESGGGLGRTTGLQSEAGARKDMTANRIGTLDGDESIESSGEGEVKGSVLSESERT